MKFISNTRYINVPITLIFIRSPRHQLTTLYWSRRHKFCARNPSFDTIINIHYLCQHKIDCQISNLSHRFQNRRTKYKKQMSSKLKIAHRNTFYQNYPINQEPQHHHHPVLPPSAIYYLNTQLISQQQQQQHYISIKEQNSH